MSIDDNERRKQNRLERFGTNNPVCDCGERDWRCLGIFDANNGHSKILCRNCYAKRTEKNSKRKPGKYSACVSCKENDPRCLEEHHIAGRALDDTCITLCLNCHSKLTDDQKDHKKLTSRVPAEFKKFVEFLLGIADALGLLKDKIYEFVHHLIESGHLPPTEGT